MTTDDLECLLMDAKGFLSTLIEKGDPFCGDDWSMVQILRRYIELHEDVKGLRIDGELYRRGYELIGACDIGNYLALCETAGNIGEGLLCDIELKMRMEKEYREGKNGD